jgi:hypothetical protein
MQLVEQHMIDQKDVRYALIDAACFASKNLYLVVHPVRIVIPRTKPKASGQ